PFGSLAPSLARVRVPAASKSKHSAGALTKAFRNALVPSSKVMVEVLPVKLICHHIVAIYSRDCHLGLPCPVPVRHLRFGYTSKRKPLPPIRKGRAHWQFHHVAHGNQKRQSALFWPVAHRFG